MKHLVTILMLLCCLAQVQAQKITRSYRNVAMPEVLRDLSQLSPDYTVSFLYNELEDFRVTTAIRHQSLPDAISLTNYWIGILKGVTFGILIALIACHFGLRIQPNTESLGRGTTTSVVTSITGVILLDALYAVIFSSVGI